jgi:hypothetical protein
MIKKTVKIDVWPFRILPKIISYMPRLDMDE